MEDMTKHFGVFFSVHNVLQTLVALVMTAQTISAVGQVPYSVTWVTLSSYQFIRFPVLLMFIDFVL